MTMTYNTTLTIKPRCHILSDNGMNPNGLPWRLALWAGWAVNPNGVPAYSKG